MSLIDELNQVIYDLPFNKHQMNRNDIAHFCEHDGICISFTRARTTWHALAPCAVKPWWLFLAPLRRKPRENLNGNKRDNLKLQDKKQEKNNDTSTTNIKNRDIEVTENA